MAHNELIHHGIIGMKWGVRRTPAQLSRTGGKGKTDNTVKKDVKSLSDDELRKMVNRLQMERQYSQLSPSSISKGKQYAQTIMKAGTTVAAVSTTALTIYNNYGKIKDIISKARS